mmetsp:Transcript_106749/g.333917  ORF Transcript_106749/g.333917 Transcript_106749/m.333917 type:complete len:218 (-) Transcript_106749:433-1086(-)
MNLGCCMEETMPLKYATVHAAPSATTLDEEGREATGEQSPTSTSLRPSSHWALAVASLGADIEEAATLRTLSSSSLKSFASPLSWFCSFLMAAATPLRTEVIASTSTRAWSSQGHSPQARHKEQDAHPVTARSALQLSQRSTARRSSHSNSTVSSCMAKCTRLGALTGEAAAVGDGVVGVESEQPRAIGSLQGYLGGHGQGAGDSGHRSGAAAARTS